MMNTDPQATCTTPDEPADMTRTRSWSWQLYMRRNPDVRDRLLAALENPTGDHEKIIGNPGIRLSDDVSQHPQKE